MPIFKARFEVNLDENHLKQILKSALSSNLETAKQALTKIFTMDALRAFDKAAALSLHHSHTRFESYAQAFPLTIAGFNKSNNVDELCRHFLHILCMPFGIRLIDKNHSDYMMSRAESIRKHNNHDNELFKGTASRRYVHGFSNHAYTFCYYLSSMREQLSDIELRCVTELFYYGYIKENYHSFCEVDAAFLRAAENYKYPGLAMELVKTTDDEQYKPEEHPPLSYERKPQEKVGPEAQSNILNQGKSLTYQDKRKNIAYDYFAATKNEGRYHFFEVQGKKFHKLKVEAYKQLKGDHLKSKILEDFHDTLYGINSLQELKAFEEQMKTTDEYKVLAHGQGMITSIFHLATSSVKALKGMIRQREKQLELESPQNLFK